MLRKRTGEHAPHFGVVPTQKKMVTSARARQKRRNLLCHLLAGRASYSPPPPGQKPEATHNHEGDTATFTTEAFWQMSIVLDAAYLRSLPALADRASAEDTEEEECTEEDSPHSEEGQHSANYRRTKAKAKTKIEKQNKEDTEAS